jgi:hypothetical protein
MSNHFTLINSIHLFLQQHQTMMLLKSGRVIIWGISFAVLLMVSLNMFHIPTASTWRPQHGRCSSGPYVYNPHCGEGEGIGSRMNYFKLGLLYALRSNSKFIHSPQCLFTDHDTDDIFEHVFAISDFEDCTEKELKTHIKDGSMRIIEYHHPLGKRAQQLIQQTLTLDLEQNLLETDSDSFLHMFQRFQHDRRNWRTVFVILAGEHADNTEAVHSPNLNENPRIFTVESYLFTRDWILNRYVKSFQQQLRQGKRASIRFKQDILNIAIHRRWGDLASKPGQILDERTMSIEYCLGVLQNILETLKISKQEFQLHVFSESSIDELDDLVKVYPHLQFWPGSPDSTVRDLDHLAHSDILIACRSSFSSLAATLNQAGIIIAPVSTKFDGINNVIFTNGAGDFDQTAFRAAVQHKEWSRSKQLTF